MKLPRFLLVVLAYLSTDFSALGKQRRMGDAAAVGLSGVGTVALTVAAVIIAAVVALTLISALFPDYSESVRSISENVSTADWGDDTANGIGPVFAMLVSLGGLFAIVGLIFLAYKLNHRSG